MSKPGGKRAKAGRKPGPVKLARTFRLPPERWAAFDAWGAQLGVESSAALERMIFALDKPGGAR
jgi:hypothetical protein